MWCVRFADTFLIGAAYIFIVSARLVVGASIARLCGLPDASHFWYGCGGRSMTAPTNRPVILPLPLGRGRGMPRPYGVVVLYIAIAVNFPLISHLR